MADRRIAGSILSGVKPWNQQPNGVACACYNLYNTKLEPFDNFMSS
jgi:hypothetical protein